MLLSLTSCTLVTTKNLVRAPIVKAEYQNLYFSNTNTDYVYKSKIDVYGNYFGGILIIKKIDKSHHRVVLTTEFGSKVFDFEFQNDNFKVNSILEELNRKMIVNTLKKDFQLLLNEQISVTKEYKNADYTIYQSQNKKRFNFYFINNKTADLEKLINTSKTKEKVIIIFNNIDGKLAKKILIAHKSIKLKITLNYLDNN
ncbi:MAG: hypothetical protein L3J20_01550 [Flavobacteriaceae bacterium]|nr:hypothetical protein [Flavobacteriaceae bacterium]